MAIPALAKRALAGNAVEGPKCRFFPALFCMTSALTTDMPDRDFFAFCTSLKPVELKAMGALSQVIHLKEAEIVYAAADPGEALYIINRGLVEVAPDDSQVPTSSTYLSRGDIFGDLESLTDRPRTHLVRACEQVSLQCIKRKDFDELARRVPTFFPYLCERLASRFSEASALALSKSHCLELTGSLRNFDLVTIYQTIVNSLQTGELSVRDENAHPVSSFFFKEGRVCSGQFEHLTGEEAFWQLFLSDTLSGTFAFSAQEESLNDCVQATEIVRNRQDMLIAALQFRDEFQALKGKLPDKSTKLHRRKLNFTWPAEAAPELQPIAEEVWQLAYSTPLSLSNLYQKCSVCELKIYQVVDELVRAKLLAFEQPETNGATVQAMVESVGT